MGGVAVACSSAGVCSKQATLVQTQPSTEKVKQRAHSSSSKHLLHTHGTISRTESGEVSGIINDFYGAIKQGNDSMVMCLMDEHRDIDFLRTSHKDTGSCLHLAVRRRAYNVIDALLREGGASVLSPHALSRDLYMITHAHSAW